MAVDDETLDLTADEVSAPIRVPVLETIAKDQERIRGWIAMGLLSLLAAAIVFSFALIAIFPGKPNQPLEELLKVVYGPLVALVSAATGFYFGGNKSR